MRLFTIRIIKNTQEKMKRRSKHPNKNKGQVIYAIYDEQTDELISVSLDYSVLDMQFELSELDRDRFEIVEFTIRLS